MAKKDEKKSLEETIKDLNKKFGANSVMTGNNASSCTQFIDTGSIALNEAIGGGWPLEGKIIDIFGWESSGKSTLTQLAIGNYQKMGLRKALLIDAENSLSKTYSSALGLDLDELLLVQLDASGSEGAYSKMEALVRTGEVGLVVIDSYNALKPKSTKTEGSADKSVSDSNIGRHAMMMGNVVDLCNDLCIRYQTTFMFIGQLRQAVGVMYGSNEIVQGGNALKFFAHVRAKVSRSTTKDNSVMDGETKLGNKTSVEIIKNKISSPFKKASFDILYGLGIDKVGELIDLAKARKVLKIWNGTITYKEEKYSEEDFRDMLDDNPEFFDEVKSKVVSSESVEQEVETEV